MHQSLMKLMLIRSLDLHHIISIPMNSHHPINQQMVFCSHARHRVFEEHRVAHRFVGGCAELLQEGKFHVARKFLSLVSALLGLWVGHEDTCLFDDSLEITSKFLLVRVCDSPDLCVAPLTQDTADEQLIRADFSLGCFV